MASLPNLETAIPENNNLAVDLVSIGNRTLNFSNKNQTVDNFEVKWPSYHELLTRLVLDWGFFIDVDQLDEHAILKIGIFVPNRFVPNEVPYRVCPKVWSHDINPKELRGTIWYWNLTDVRRRGICTKASPTTVRPNYGSRSEVHIGSSIGAYKDHNGSLHFVVDDKDLGVAVENIPRSFFYGWIRIGNIGDVKITHRMDLSFGYCSRHVLSKGLPSKEIQPQSPTETSKKRKKDDVSQPSQNAPSEILARGPKAQRAYQTALESGKTKNLRVPVMLVGQSCAGKTSLLRSLKGEKFDPEEDSTEGVKLHRSISKAEEEVWRVDETTENSYYDCVAKAIISTQEDDDENPSFLTNKENLQVDVPTIEKRKSVDLSDGTEEQEKTPENSSEYSMPDEVVEKLQNQKTMENDESIHFMTIDFAGQPVYQVTHPVFLSPKGIYILVHSLKNDAHELATPIVRRGSLEPRKIDDNCPMTNMDHLEFWLSFVSSNANVIEDNANQEPQVQGLKLPRKFPPVFLVLTHADEPFEKQNSEEVSIRILAYLKKEENPSGQHLVHAIYPIDNTVSGSTEKEENEFVKKLREDIRVAAEHLLPIDEDIPIRWRKFEMDLAEIKHKKYITLEEAKNIARKCQVDLESDELDTLLNYLHDLKVIIYFEYTNMIIIDTQWLLEMFVKVITVQPFLRWEQGFEACWEMLENEGVLERILIEHLWSDVADEQNTIDVLLTVMEKFSLLCRWKRLDGSEVFLVPAMLVNSIAKNAEMLADPLVIRFTRAHLPLGIFPRMLVAIAELCNKKWPNSRLPKFFHNFCRFYDVGGENGLLDSSLDLVVMSDMRTITVGVIPITNNVVSHNWDLIVEFCQSIKEFIYDTLNDMRRIYPWMKNMCFEFGIFCPICSTSKIPCNCHKNNACIRDTCTHFIPEKELPRCYDDPTNSKTVINKESYSHWFPKTAKNSLRIQEEETVEPESALQGPSGTPGHEIVPSAAQGHELSLPESSSAAKAKFEKLVEELNLYKTSMKDPPAEAVKRFRNVCQQFVGVQRQKWIEELRKYVPSGTTGPLEEENKPYEQLDAKKKQDLTRALCGQEVPRRIVCEFGKSKSWEYYDRQKNPVEVLLEEESKKRSLTVGGLYDVLVKCEANAVADEYL